MLYRNRWAKINVRLLVILVLVVTAVGISLAAARQIRRSILSKMSLDAGKAAFEKKDWRAAYKNLQEYLGRNPDDVEILRKYAQARLSVRPLEAANLHGAIAAYRRIIQLDPRDEAAYKELASLYTGTGNFEDLAYLARTRLEHDPNDREAPLWLASGLVQLNKKKEARETLSQFMAQLEALPDKCPEYVQACIQMSGIAATDGSRDARANALKELDKAVDYAPDSAEALVQRARFHRDSAALAATSEPERKALQDLAHENLKAADALHPKNPKILYALGAEWLAQGELDQADAALQAIDGFSVETLEEHFFDIHDWKVARFLFASELAIRRGAMAEAVSLADETLAVLTERRHRVRVIPAIIPIYVSTGKVPEARRCVDEYVDAVRAPQAAPPSAPELAWLQALVAAAEGRPYVAIDLLQPVALNNSYDTNMWRLWRLLAEAYSRTDQTARAINAQLQCLRFYPGDPQMLAALARQYSRLGDWKRAFETAQAAESAGAADLAARLLRIGAGINLAIGPDGRADAARLKDLAAELADLRQAQPDQVGIRIFQALIAGVLGQSEEVEKELKLAIEQCKESLRAELQLAGHYLGARRIAEALGVCAAACQRHPEAAEPWLSLSDIHVANSDYDSARDSLTRGLEAVTKPLEKRSLSVRLALLELQRADWKAAGMARLKNLASQDANDIRTRRILLGTAEIQDDRAAAERLVQELQTAEGQAGLWWRLHRASLWLGSSDWRSKQADVTSLLRYCIDADPQWSAPVLLLARMYERLGDRQRVEDTYRQALVRNPSAVEMADRLLTILLQQGRGAEANRILKQIQVTPQVRSALHVRKALGLGDETGAIEELQRRVADEGQDARSLVQLARLVYQQNKEVDRALAYLKQAEGLDPGLRTLAAVRASIYRAEGQEEQARRILDDYVADHNDFDAYWMRAVFLAEAGETDRAEEDYRKLTTFAAHAAAGYELLANFYTDTARLDRGIAVLEEALGVEACSKNLGLWRRLMLLLFQRAQGQDRDKALAILAELEAERPQSVELMIIRAQQLLQERTPQGRASARAKLEKAVELEPTAINAHLMLIAVAMEEGNHRAVRDYAVRGLASNANHLVLLSARARAELGLENVPMAIQLARLVLQEDPNHTEAIHMLLEAGQRSDNRDLLEEARTRIEAAVRRAPANETLLLSRAHILTALNLPKAAIPELETYCQTAPGSRSVAAFVTLADLYRLAGDMERSERWIAQAQRLDRDSQTVTHARLLWLVSQNRWEELKGISSAYLAAPAQDPALLVRAGSVLVAASARELKQEGLRLLEHVATLSPTSVDARLGLASALYQTGDAKRAEVLYREVLGQHPEQVRALNDLAWILQEHHQRYEAALELADKGLKLAPDDRHLLDTRGTILANLPDRLADAKNDFQKLAGLSPAGTREKAKALLQLGRVCVKLSDAAQAKQHLQAALDIDRQVNVLTEAERAEIAKITQRSGT